MSSENHFFSVLSIITQCEFSMAVEVDIYHRKIGRLEYGMVWVPTFQQIDNKLAAPVPQTRTLKS